MTSAERQQSALAGYLTKIRQGDTAARLTAVEEVTQRGAGVVEPLGKMVGDPDPGIAKTATEALRRLAYHASRPGAGAERRAVTRELTKLLRADYMLTSRREALNLLGCLDEGASVPEIAELIEEPDLVEAVLAALERIPGRAAETALRAALNSSGPLREKRAAIEQALTHRRAQWGEVGIKR